MKQISAFEPYRRPARTVDITSVRCQEDQDETVSQQRGSPWRIDFTKEVNLNGAPETRNQEKQRKTGPWKDIVHKALKHISIGAVAGGSDERVEVVCCKCSSWPWSVGGRSFYSFFAVFRSEETTTRGVGGPTSPGTFPV